MEEILEVAQADSDRWVSVLGELMRNYPSAGVLAENFVNEENKKIFEDLLMEIKNMGNYSQTTLLHCIRYMIHVNVDIAFNNLFQNYFLYRPEIQ